MCRPSLLRRSECHISAAACQKRRRAESVVVQSSSLTLIDTSSELDPSG